MATTPVDDPRTPKPRRRSAAAAAAGGTVEQQVTGAIEQGFAGLSDTVLKGFDTVLATSNAALKEVAEAKRDLQQTLDMVIRAKADALALGGGMGGMAPAAARTPVAVAVQELNEAKEIRHRAAQSTDQNYQRQTRDPVTGRFVKRQAAVEQVQQQREDRFDAADQRRQEATAQREEQHQARQEVVDRHDVERDDRVAQAQSGTVSPASTGARERLNYNAAFAEGGFRGVQAQTRSNIRERVYRAAASRAETYVDPEGMSSDIATRQVGQVRPGLRADTASENFFDEAGNVVSRADALTDVGSQSAFRRRSMLAQTGMRSLNAWREGAPIGRSLAAALPEGLIQGAGTAAVVVTAANKIWQGIQSQAEKNREFQSVYAGGLGEQADDRMAQWVNRNITGRFSLLGSGNYDALFSQAMQQGLRGDDRKGYIREGAQIMETGASREQTGQILGIAVEAGQALNGLSDAIKSVNAAAKDAGINASRAREIFIKNYQASSDALFGSASSQRMATAMTQSQVGMARQFQDVDITGAYTGATRERLIASRAGVPYTEYLGQIRDNPTAGMLASEAVIQEHLNNLRSEKPGAPRLPELVQQFMDSLGGAENFNPQFDQRRLGDFIVDAGYSPEQIAMMLQGDGVQLNNINDAPAVAAMYYTNQTPGQIGARTEAEQIAAITPTAANSTFTSEEQVNQYSGAAMGGADTLKLMYLQGITPGPAEMAGNFPMNDESATVGQQRNLIVEQLLNTDTLTSMGVGQNTMIAVMTSGGRRIVPLSWALQNAPDQIPNATIIGGAHDDVTGKTVIEALNLPSQAADMYADAAVPTLTEADRKNDEQIMSMREWQEAHPVSEDQTGTTEPTHVVLDLTPRAAMMLQQQSTSAPYQTGNPGTGSTVVDVVTQGGD
jgi:hypothetical protein